MVHKVLTFASFAFVAGMVVWTATAERPGTVVAQADVPSAGAAAGD